MHNEERLFTFGVRSGIKPLAVWRNPHSTRTVLKSFKDTDGLWMGLLKTGEERPEVGSLGGGTVVSAGVARA